MFTNNSIVYGSKIKKRKINFEDSPLYQGGNDFIENLEHYYAFLFI